MKSKPNLSTKRVVRAIVLMALTWSSVGMAQNAGVAQQIPIPTTAAEVPGPTPGTAMTQAYVQTVGRMAYLWGWPLVNMANRGIASSKTPEPGLMGGVIPVMHALIRPRSRLDDLVKVK